MPSLKDIAQLANVSVCTVSRALNGHPSVKQSTRSIILKAADELGYNVKASNIYDKSMKNIGIFISSEFENLSMHPSLAEIIKGINYIARNENNLNLILIIGKGNTSPSSKLLETIENNRLDGILLTETCIEDEKKLIPILKSKGIPFVVINRIIPDRGVSFVGIDNSDAVYNAVEYLIKLNHKDIGFIKASNNFQITFDRLEGYKKALTENNIPIKNSLIVDGDFSEKSGYDSMQKMLQLQSIPTAVFCCSDAIAVGAMKVIKEKGMRIPEDISIIGFGNISMASFTEPPLTTISNQSFETGKIATHTLLDIINNNSIRDTKVTLKTDLLVRNSCTEPRRLNKQAGFYPDC